MSKKKVLIIEDNKLILDYIEKLLYSNFNCELDIFTAETYSDSIQIIDSNIIDIFLIDITLSNGQEGIDIARKIRESKNKNAAIIFETADSQSIFKLANDVHFFGYLVKPYNAKELIFLFSKFLSKEISELEIPSQTIDLDYKNAHLDNSIYEVSINKNIITRIRLCDIVYLEAGSKRISVCTINETIDTYYLTLDSFLIDNQDKYFHRCHKGFIFNTKYFKHYDKKRQVIFLQSDNNSVIIPVGRKYAGKIRDFFEVTTI